MAIPIGTDLGGNGMRLLHLVKVNGRFLGFAMGAIARADGLHRAPHKQNHIPIWLTP